MWRPKGGYPGWLLVDGKLRPDPTVTGCRLRGIRTIRGECRSDPCRRYIKIEMEALERQGYGGSDVREIERLWRCIRVSSCGLMWHDHVYSDGVPLAGYLDSQCVVVIRCKACQAAKTFSIPELIDTLEKRGSGGVNTSVLKVAGAITTPCRRCKAQAWEAKLDWGRNGTV